MDATILLIGAAVAGAAGGGLAHLVLQNHLEWRVSDCEGAVGELMRGGQGRPPGSGNVSKEEVENQLGLLTDLVFNDKIPNDTKVGLIRDAIKKNPLASARAIRSGVKEVKEIADELGFR